MHTVLTERPYRPRRTSWTAIVLSFAVSTMLLLLLIFLLLEPHSGDFQVSHSYSVDIDATNDETYELLFPVPTNSSGELRKAFSHDVKVLRGEVTISVVSSERGPALMIKGRGDANISWTDRWSGSWQSQLTDLSMSHWQGGSLSLHCWAYCGNDGITIHLRSESTGLLTSDGTPRGHTTSRTIDGGMTPDGWQLMSVVTDESPLI